MKRIFIGIAAAGILLTSGIPVFAETATTSASALIQTLQQQIVALQAQLDALAKARAAVVAASGQVTETAQLLRNLREGMSGDDVKTLQAILAKDSNLYPEGLISGFFGKATARAVKRFQERENISAVGSVGPRTLEKLAKELEKDPLGKEDDDQKDHGEKRPCAMVPPGYLIAPGWLRKHDNEHPIVPPCQKLPPGIEREGDDYKATTTPDTTVPVISEIRALDLTGTSARVSWNTNEKSTGRIWYSTVSPVVAASTTLSVSSGTLTKERNLALAGLTANTTYYYVIESSDGAGNKAMSLQQAFTTPVTSDTTAPIISGVSATNITLGSGHIVWTTNENADSSVWYSTSTPIIVPANASAVYSGSLISSHNISLSGLATSTVYYYMVGSKDVAGNSATSTQYSFTTLVQ